MRLIYNLACAVLSNGIHNARCNMACTMHNGLTPIMSGPQPHSHQWPLDENEPTEMCAHMHEYQGLNLRHGMPLYQSMAGDDGWHTNTFDTALNHDKQWSRIVHTWRNMQAGGARVQKLVKCVTLGVPKALHQRQNQPQTDLRQV